MNMRNIINKFLKQTVMLFLLFVFTFQARAAEPFQTPKISENRPIKATAKEMILERKLNKITLIDNAKVKQDTNELKADKMIMEYFGSETKTGTSNKLKTINAYSNVEFTTEKMLVNSNEGHYDAQNGLLTLLGDVVAIEGKTAAKGEKFFYNVKTGESKIEGSSKSKDVDSNNTLEEKDDRVIIILEEERIQNTTEEKEE